MTSLRLTNWPMFFRAARMLRKDDWIIENPAEHDIIKGYDPTLPPTQQNWTKAGLLLEDFEIIVTRCKAMIFLPGWRNSEGSLIEFAIAYFAGLSLFFFEETDQGYRLVPITSRPKVVLQND